MLLLELDQNTHLNLILLLDLEQGNLQMKLPLLLLIVDLDTRQEVWLEAPVICGNGSVSAQTTIPSGHGQ